MLSRDRALGDVAGLLRRHPLVAILGARQVGKTTLAREIAKQRKRTIFYDLEDAADLASLREPMLELRGSRGLVVIDEVQQLPELFPALRVLSDEPGKSRKFLILGSASPDLLREASESLAGRIFHYELDGFGLDEVDADRGERLWLRGGFPRSFLAKTEDASFEWREGFARTFLERDVPRLGIRIPAETLDRFWAMLAHYHGQIWNAQEFARSFGVSGVTVDRYLSILTGTFLVRRLRPWHENLKKRQVKSPKIWFKDSGILHHQLGIRTRRELVRHPKLGASFEGHAMSCVVRALGASSRECYFWATHTGSELDLLVVRGPRRFGFEFKHSETPAVTRSMRIAMQDLELKELDVVHPGPRTYALEKGIRALALHDVPTALRRIR